MLLFLRARFSCFNLVLVLLKGLYVTKFVISIIAFFSPFFPLPATKFFE